MEKFTISAGLMNDILYCQKSLNSLINVHQMCAAVICTGKKNVNVKRKLVLLENELADVGAEQKLVIDRLRVALDSHYAFLEKNNISVDRKSGSVHVQQQLLKYFKSNYDNVFPLNVKRRLSQEELTNRFLLSNDTNNKGNPFTNFTKTNNFKSMESTISQYDTSAATSSNYQFQSHQQQSINRSKSDRVDPVQLFKSKTNGSIVTNNGIDHDLGTLEGLTKSNTDAPLLSSSQMTLTGLNNYTDSFVPIKKPTSISMNNSRMNLLQALNKAKHKLKVSINDQQSTTSSSISSSPELSHITDFSLSLPPSPLQALSPPATPKTPPTPPSPQTPPPSVTAKPTKRKRKRTSSDRVSGESITMPDVDLPEEIPEPLELEKDDFLKLFGLYTHEYSDFLRAKRNERKKRSVNSNEKSDFHYGKKYAFFESQMKRNIRRKMLTPPSKRAAAKKRRKANEIQARKIKATAKVLPTSPKHEDGKNQTCNICLKIDSALNTCTKCNSYFHKNCDKIDSSISSNKRSSHKCCTKCSTTEINSADVK